jgi:endonuclease/exonuclease/phosphatase family metal-dependent hydrolase
MWTLMGRIAPMSDKLWMMMGDFNEAMWEEEHYSNTRRSEKQMLDFREVLSHYDLHDLGFTGASWTFDNKQKGDRNVKVRIDWAVATPAWSTLYLEHRLSHLVSSRSDHIPILLSVERATNCRPERPIRPY